MTFRPFRARVHATQRLSPHFLRITLTGEDLRGFRPVGPVLDLRIKLIIPGSSGILPQLDADTDWFTTWSGLPEDERGHMRTYSVRALSTVDGQTRLVVDFALHLGDGDTGPAARWARDARPGDEITVIGPTAGAPAGAGVEFAPGEASDIVLLGDETAAPAIARILEDLPATARGRALIEVPTRADVLAVDSPAGFAVSWLPRHGGEHGHALLSRLGLAPGGEGTDDASAAQALVWETPGFSAAGEPVDVDTRGADGTYWWIAGESGMVTALRRHLVKERGVARSQVAFMGYWKRGVAMRG